MAKIQVSLLLGCSLFAAACIVNSIDGSGTIVTEPRSVSGFSAVSLGGAGHVVIEQTGTESLTVTTDDNLLPYIRTEVRGHTLELGFTDSLTNPRPTHDVVFKLTVKTIEGLDLSGSGSAVAKGLDPDHLTIGISGSGEVAAQGTVKDLALSISGSGRYLGEDMRSNRASVHVSGSGGAVMAVSETLDVNVSGSGAIGYIGDPTVISHISGSGSVYRR